MYNINKYINFFTIQKEVKYMINKSILTKPLYYRILDSTELGLNLNISAIGYEECTKNKMSIISNKNCYVIHFVLKGKGFLKFEKGQKIAVEENNCFLIKPNQQIKYFPNKQDPWTYFWIEFNWEQFEKFIPLLEFEANNNILPLYNSQIIKNYMYDIFNENLYAPNSYSEFLRVEGIANHIFSYLFSNSKIKTSKNNFKKDEKFKAIIEYINNNYASPDITINEISKKFFFNVSYISRFIKSETGMSPKKLIISLRMKKALELLKNENYTISEIADKLGYKNQFYFSKEFKEYYGVSPINYKIN